MGTLGGSSCNFTLLEVVMHPMLQMRNESCNADKGVETHAGTKKGLSDIAHLMDQKHTGWPALNHASMVDKPGSAAESSRQQSRELQASSKERRLLAPNTHWPKANVSYCLRTMNGRFATAELAGTSKSLLQKHKKQGMASQRVLSTLVVVSSQGFVWAAR